MSEFYTSIKKWLEANKENLVSDIIQSLEIAGDSYNREVVRESLAQLLGIAEKLGFKTELRANGEVGVVFFGEGAETLGILAHADVVPIGDPGLWKHSPYGELAENRIYGRGVVDNKGMVISSLYAMAAVKAMKLPVYKKAELIIGTREEIVWDDLELYKKEGHSVPDYGFTPDGEFPIINREKGNCEIHVVFHGDACSGEVEVMELKSGEAVNSVPGRAYARLKGEVQSIMANAKAFNESLSQDKLILEQLGIDELGVTAIGKEYHSSLPQFGDNALTTLCVFLDELSINNTAVKKLTGFVSSNLKDNYYGDSLKLPVHPEVQYGEEMGRTTVVPSMVYMENGINLFLSIRTVYGTIKGEMLAAFDSLSRVYGFTYSIHDYLEPLYVPKDHGFIEILSKNYEEVTGEKTEYILAGGTTYAKALPNTVAFGPVFPGNAEVAHQIDEYIEVEGLMKATEIYSLIVSEVLLKKESLKK